MGRKAEKKVREWGVGDCRNHGQRDAALLALKMEKRATSL